MNGGYYDSRSGPPVAARSDDRYSARYSAPANEDNYYQSSSRTGSADFNYGRVRGSSNFSSHVSQYGPPYSSSRPPVPEMNWTTPQFQDPYTLQVDQDQQRMQSLPAVLAEPDNRHAEAYMHVPPSNPRSLLRRETSPSSGAYPSSLPGSLNAEPSVSPRGTREQDMWVVPPAHPYAPKHSSGLISTGTRQYDPMPNPRQQIMEPMPSSSAVGSMNPRQYDPMPDSRQQVMDPMPSSSALASVSTGWYDPMPEPRRQQQIMEPVPSSRSYSSSVSMSQASWNDPAPVPSQRMMEPLLPPGAYSSLPTFEQTSWNTPQLNQYSMERRSPYDLHPSRPPSSPTSHSTQLYDPSHRPRQQDRLPVSSDRTYSSTQPHAPASWSDQPHDNQSSHSRSQSHGYVEREGPSGYAQRDNVVQREGSAQSAGPRDRFSYHKQASIDLLPPGEARKCIEPQVLEKKPRIEDLMKMLAKFGQKWKLFGELLYVPPDFLDDLSGNRLQPRDCLEKVLTQWLNASRSNATWEFLINVLRRRERDLPEVADRVIGFLAKPEMYTKYR